MPQSPICWRLESYHVTSGLSFYVIFIIFHLQAKAEVDSTSHGKTALHASIEGEIHRWVSREPVVPVTGPLSVGGHITISGSLLDHKAVWIETDLSLKCFKLKDIQRKTDTDLNGSLSFGQPCNDPHCSNFVPSLSTYFEWFRYDQVMIAEFLTDSGDSLVILKMFVLEDVGTMNLFMVIFIHFLWFLGGRSKYQCWSRSPSPFGSKKWPGGWDEHGRFKTLFSSAERSFF